MAELGPIMSRSSLTNKFMCRHGDNVQKQVNSSGASAHHVDTLQKKGTIQIMARYYTPAEIAQTLLVKRATVYAWLRDGSLDGSIVDGFWQISEKDLQAFCAENGYPLKP